MASEARTPNPDADADADARLRGYEARDVGVRVIVVLLAGFAVVFAGLCWGLWALTNHELSAAKQPSARSVVTKTQVGRDAPPLQPSPGHQSLDAWDLATMRSQEDGVFKALGWTMNERTHRYDVPAAIVSTLQSRKTRPATSVPATTPASEDKR